MSTESFCQIAYIYVLKDPRSGEIRYVGATKNPRERLRQHKTQSARMKCHLGAWIRQLKADGVSPAIQFIQVTDMEGWADAEKSWIERLRSSGARLVNTTVGGRGILFHGPDASRRWSEINKQTWAKRGDKGKEVCRKRAKTFLLSPESQRKSAEANRARFKSMSPEERRQHVERTGLFKPEIQAKAAKKLAEAVRRMSPEQKRQASLKAVHSHKSRMSPEQWTAKFKAMSQQAQEAFRQMPEEKRRAIRQMGSYKARMQRISRNPELYRQQIDQFIMAGNIAWRALSPEERQRIGRANMQRYLADAHNREVAKERGRNSMKQLHETLGREKVLKNIHAARNHYQASETKEQRSARMKKTWQTIRERLGEDGIRQKWQEGARKRRENSTPEQRRAAALKQWETKRKRADAAEQSPSESG